VTMGDSPSCRTVLMPLNLWESIIGISSVNSERTFIKAGYVGTAERNETKSGIILQTVIQSVLQPTALAAQGEVPSANPIIRTCTLARPFLL
jgi:hypothetical protein